VCQLCAAQKSPILTLPASTEATILKEGWRSCAWQFARQCPRSEFSRVRAFGKKVQSSEEVSLSSQFHSRNLERFGVPIRRRCTYAMLHMSSEGKRQPPVRVYSAVNLGALSFVPAWV
jgi:hypothetical protein